MTLVWATLTATLLVGMVLTVILTTTLVVNPPDLGTAYATQFYRDLGAPNWIVPVTSTCAPVPYINYGNVRTQSNTLFGALDVNTRVLSNLAWAWGQLIQHDLFLLNLNTSDVAQVTLAPGTTIMNMSSLITRAGVGTTQNIWGCPEVQNLRTGIIDGSPIYSDALNPDRLTSLRSFVRGQMLVSAGNNLPFVDSITKASFLAGDVNVNENSLLAALIALFVREHNWWAVNLFQVYPGWSDEQLFWKARSYVVAEIQAITYGEWIPYVFQGLGGLPIVPPAFSSSSQVSTEYALVASEFYRSMLNGASTPYVANVTGAVLDNTVDGLLRLAWNTSGLQMDSHVSATQCNNTLTNYDYISQDLVYNIQAGTANYSAIRVRFMGTSPNPIFETAASPYDTTPLSGVLAEPIPNPSYTSLNPTVSSIILDQLRRSAQYDPQFYTRPTVRNQLGLSIYAQLSGTHLADVLYRNTYIVPPPGGTQPSAFIKV